MFMKNWKKEIATIPNLLSTFRLLLIPVYVRIYLHAAHPSQYLLAGSLLVISCLTDLVDGKIARKYHMISTLGKILDPIADKATQFTLIFCLSLTYGILRPVLILFVIKEAFQASAGILAWRNGKILPGALPAGKYCTTVLFISLTVMIFFPGINRQIVQLFAGMDAFFLFASFISYILAYYGKNPKLQDISSE